MPRNLISILVLALAATLGCTLSAAPAAKATPAAKPAPAAKPIQIIPQPQSVKPTKGVFTFARANIYNQILTSKPFLAEATLFATELNKATGLNLRPNTGRPHTMGGAMIFFDKLKGDHPAGTYTLKVEPTQIAIKAADAAGAFYATRTLLQMLPPAVFKDAKHNKNVKWTIPCCTITDSPRFAWRGYMIDDSRHFYGVEKIKRYLDLMALHKLNVFHWHLTDDQGWRIEIKGYPKLTTVGAQRGDGLPLPRQTRRKSDPAVYGGFYTQEQIKEIVAYAAARHINIMPEIDVPGHSKAAGAAYP